MSALQEKFRGLILLEKTKFMYRTGLVSFTAILEVRDIANYSQQSLNTYQQMRFATRKHMVEQRGPDK